MVKDLSRVVQASQTSKDCSRVPNLAEKTVLQKIVELRHTRIPALRQQLAELKAQGFCRTRPLFPFREAIRKRVGPALIMECKAASPSQGQLSSNYDPVVLARRYQPYAAAISVLTEPDFFQGSFRHLQAVAQTVQLPVLAKDFIIDEAQIELAYLMGADAVLLMLSVLDDQNYRQLAHSATRLGLDILTEVFSEEEAQRASRLGANLVDINHRNLHTLEIDLDRCTKLAPKLGSNTVVVAASGMNDAAQIRARLGVAQGFLCGSALTGAKDFDFALKKLVFGETKICGLNSLESARAAQSFCTYGGLIWVEKSPRKVDLADSMELVKACPGLRFLVVTLSRELADLARIIKLAEQVGAGGIQLHYPLDLGSGPVGETVQGVDLLAAEIDLLTQLRKLAPPGFFVVRAVPVQAGVELIQGLVESRVVDRVLVDSASPGSGQTWDIQTLPAQLRSRVWLAGGLGLANLDRALYSGAAGLDFNSALETRPGVKDPGLIRALASALHPKHPKYPSNPDVGKVTRPASSGSATCPTSDGL